jgi:hypothetical protein
MAHEDGPLVVIQRQLGHANPSAPRNGIFRILGRY